MTPMIDVVFLLLIFFICTASFQASEQNLPGSLRIAEGAGTRDIEIPPELEDLQQVIVKIFWQDNRPRWEINRERLETLEQVRQILAAVATIDAELPVVLDIAGEVPLGHVIQIYDLGRGLGFAKIQFAAAVPSTE